FDELMLGHAYRVFAQQRHKAMKAQGYVEIGAAFGQPPIADDMRVLVAAQLGKGHVGGSAADVDDKCGLTSLQTLVIMHRRSGGLFEKTHLVEASDGGRL